jgi:hypothetical protein
MQPKKADNCDARNHVAEEFANILVTLQKRDMVELNDSYACLKQRYANQITDDEFAMQSCQEESQFVEEE